MTNNSNATPDAEAKSEFSENECAGLEHSHDVDAIRKRLARPSPKSYLRDGIYGAIDGAVTTFAVVSGVSGAGLSPEIVIILGVANLIGDGFSMAAGNFLGTRAENQQVERFRAIENKHIQRCPEGEREEVRQILILEGYEGELLDATVAHITADNETWTNTMLQHEYGVSTHRPSAIPAALMTFVSFLVIGIIPLLPFIAQWLFEWGLPSFAISSVMTGVAFYFVGTLKARYVDQHWFWAGVETLAVGAIASALAYACGYGLSRLGLA